MTPNRLARAAMTGMPPGTYVCAMTDYGDGMTVGEWYPARDATDARRISRTVRQSYSTVTTVTLPAR